MDFCINEYSSALKFKRMLRGSLVPMAQYDVIVRCGIVGLVEAALHGLTNSNIDSNILCQWVPLITSYSNHQGTNVVYVSSYGAWTRRSAKASSDDAYIGRNAISGLQQEELGWAIFLGMKAILSSKETLPHHINDVKNLIAELRRSVVLRLDLCISSDMLDTLDGE